MSAIAAPPEHVCVPAAGGGWACGDESAPPTPAALPSQGIGTPSPAPAPPLLLIDPKRFRLEQVGVTPTAAPEPSEVPAPPPAAPPPVAAVSAEVAPALAAPPPAEPTPAAEPPAVVVSPSAAAASDAPEFSALPSGQYTLQLAAASVPDGFGPLLRRLGVSEPSWQLRLMRGGQTLWVLVMGVYPDAASARAAVPAGANGAFPKPVVQLQQELAAAP